MTVGGNLCSELTTGMRRGQLCGQKWTAVDLEAGEITVHDNRVVVWNAKHQAKNPETNRKSKAVRTKCHE